MFSGVSVPLSTEGGYILSTGGGGGVQPVHRSCSGPVQEERYDTLAK